MVQDTPRRVRDQIHLLRESRQLPFRDLLDRATILDALAAGKVAFRPRSDRRPPYPGIHQELSAKVC